MHAPRIATGKHWLASSQCHPRIATGKHWLTSSQCHPRIATGKHWLTSSQCHPKVLVRVEHHVQNAVIGFNGGEQFRGRS